MRKIGLRGPHQLRTNTKWRKLPLAVDENDKVREVRTANWGFAMANVNITKGPELPTA